jgi:hypothetical protein
VRTVGRAGPGGCRLQDATRRHRRPPARNTAICRCAAECPHGILLSRGRVEVGREEPRRRALRLSSTRGDPPIPSPLACAFLHRAGQRSSSNLGGRIPTEHLSTPCPGDRATDPHFPELQVGPHNWPNLRRTNVSRGSTGLEPVSTRLRTTLMPKGASNPPGEGQMPPETSAKVPRTQLWPVAAVRGPAGVG